MCKKLLFAANISTLALLSVSDRYMLRRLAILASTLYVPTIHCFQIAIAFAFMNSQCLEYVT